jgi:hypothetical protein
MEFACIARCIGVAVLVVSLQARAQAPEGKGRPEHAGASPFIRFPVPQNSVGLIRRADFNTLSEAPSPRGRLASGEAMEISTSKPVGPGAVNGKAEKLVQTNFLVPGELPDEKKASPPECGAR